VPLDHFSALHPDYDGWSTDALLRHLLTEAFPGRIAIVSSFGAESAVLLHHVAAIDPATPVLFVDTGKLFAETLAYRETLCWRLGLTAIRTVTAPDAVLTAVDPVGALWQTDPDLCCEHRKVAPLDAALIGYDAWITGRKRFQGGGREALPVVEAGRPVKANPLANWTEADIAAYRTLHSLPPHPLEAQGYRSIGCAPCTRVPAAGEASRAGRWAGLGKTECGIHLPRTRTAA